MGKNFFRYFFLVVLGTVLITSTRCCRKHQPTANRQTENAPSEATSPPKESPSILAIERTPCYGQCPAYKVDFKEGGVAFLSVRHLDRIPPGRYMTKINPEDLTMWQEMARGAMAEMRQMEGEQPVAVDFPGLIITMEGRSVSYTLQRTPPQLKAFLTEFDQWVHSMPWKSVPSETPENEKER